MEKWHDHMKSLPRCYTMWCKDTKYTSQDVHQAKNSAVPRTANTSTIAKAIVRHTYYFDVLRRLAF